MVKPEKFGQLHLAYHFTVPLTKLLRKTKFHWLEISYKWQVATENLQLCYALKFYLKFSNKNLKYEKVFILIFGFFVSFS